MGGLQTQSKRVPKDGAAPHISTVAAPSIPERKEMALRRPKYRSEAHGRGEILSSIARYPFSVTGESCLPDRPSAEVHRNVLYSEVSVEVGLLTHGRRPEETLRLRSDLREVSDRQ